MTEPENLDDLELDLDLSLESRDDPKDELELMPLPADGASSGSALPGAAAAPLGAAPGAVGADGAPGALGGSAAGAGSGAGSGTGLGFGSGAGSGAGLALAGGAALGASAVSESSALPATDSGAGVAQPAAEDGMWVWQYAAPAPLPSFSAVFFGGRGLPELYRFFACGLLVAIGCLLPWGTSLSWIAEQGQPTLGVSDPPAGYTLPMGALCLALAVWLMFTACYGIFSGRQEILPVFLMLIPAWASWSRTLAAWAKVSELPLKLRFEKLFEVAGPGVMLTLIGSTIMVLSLVVVILKVLKKKPDDGTTRAPRKGKEKDDAGKASDTKAAKPVAAAADDAGKRGRKR